jgi:two-component system NtrC family sensor kinase
VGEVLQMILAVLPFDSAAVFMRGDGGSTPRLVAHRGVRPEFAALAGGALASAALGEGLLGGSLDPWVVPDVACEPQLASSLLQRLQIGGFVAVPLWAAGGTLGVLTVHTVQPRPFASDEVALVAAAGEQLGIGVQGLRLLTAEKRRAGELAILNEVSAAVGTSLDSQVIADQALEAVLRTFRASAGLVYMLEPETPAPRLVAQRGLSLESARSWTTEPPVGWDPQQGVAGGAQWGDLSTACTRPDLAEAEGLVSYASAPLRGQRQTLGLLVALTREPRALLANELELFLAVAHEVGLALENANLYREAQQQLADLQALQQFSERILHTMQEGIFILGTGGLLSYATPRLAEISGYTVDELIGEDWRTLVPLEDRSHLESCLEPIGGSSTRCEFDLLRKDGKARHVSVHAVPLYDGEELAGLLGVVSDLTEEVQLRRRLQQAERLSAIGELVSGIAHELNNPLTVIRGYAQLLLGQAESAARSRELVAISGHAERAARIVQGLLTFARERPMELEVVDLNAVLESVVDMCEWELEASHVKLIRKLQPDLPRLRADPHQLQQLFLNILLNAGQALAGREDGEVVIRSSAPGGDSVLVAISDNGPGIPAALLDRIFDPFFTTKASQHGTGLGLAICYGIANAHRGRIWAESVEGQGATFFVTLPVLAPEPRPAPAVRERPVVEVPAGGCRVLIVEDEIEIAELVARCLESLGLSPAIAHEGHIALRMVEQEEFELILTDLKMPGMSGRDLFAYLGNAKPHLAQRVVFVTGDTVSPETQRFLSECGRPHLAKPFSLEEMESLVLTTLESVR